MQGVDFQLLPGYVQNLVVVQNLDIGPGYGYTDVVPGFLQVGGGALQVQPGQFDALRRGQSVKERHAAAQVEVGGGGVAPLVGVVPADSAAETPVLTGRCADAGRPGPVGRILIDGAPFTVDFLLGYGEIVLQCPGGALFQRPGPGEVGEGVAGGLRKKGQAYQ